MRAKGNGKSQPEDSDPFQRPWEEIRSERLPTLAAAASEEANTAKQAQLDLLHKYHCRLLVFRGRPVDQRLELRPGQIGASTERLSARRSSPDGE